MLLSQFHYYYIYSSNNNNKKFDRHRLQLHRVNFRLLTVYKHLWLQIFWQTNRHIPNLFRICICIMICGITITLNRSIVTGQFLSVCLRHALFLRYWTFTFAVYVTAHDLELSVGCLLCQWNMGGVQVLACMSTCYIQCMLYFPMAWI